MRSRCFSIDFNCRCEKLEVSSIVGIFLSRQSLNYGRIYGFRWGLLKYLPAFSSCFWSILVTFSQFFRVNNTISRSYLRFYLGNNLKFCLISSTSTPNSSQYLTSTPSSNSFSFPSLIIVCSLIHNYDYVENFFLNFNRC